MSLKVKDIAKMLGLSPATVSLALNGKPGISESTRKKIFDLVDELGYSDKLAKKNFLKKSIGFLIYKQNKSTPSDTSFFSEVLEGIEIRCRLYGYKLMISYLDGASDIKNQIQELTCHSCDGFILLATEMQAKDFKLLKQIKSPIVILDNYFDFLKTDCVVINNKQGAFEATQHLIQQGHRKIGYLKSNFRLNNFQERYEGFNKALKYNSLKLEEDSTIVLGYSIETSYDKMLDYLRLNKTLPTAFFADNDIVALGALKALLSSGYKIPDDISIIGFDNIPLTEILEPTLTTIHVPKKSLGILAVDRLILQLTTPSDEFIKIQLGTKLIYRNSTNK